MILSKRKLAFATVLALTALAGGSGSVAAAQSTFGSIKPVKVGKYTVGTGAFSSALRRGAAPGGAYASVRKGGSSVDYQGQGATVTGKHMKGKFGKFGKLDVRFHKSGPFKKRTLPKGCHGTAEKRQKGTWKGIFKFKGEGGIGKVKRHELKGSRVKPGRYHCSGPSKTVVSLGASTTGGIFNATVRESGGKPQFHALVTDHKRGADIFRAVFARGKSSHFTYAPDYTSATVKPKGAFSGTGNYLAQTGLPRGTINGTVGTLSGNLKVKFLGDSGKASRQSNNADLGEYTLIPLRARDRLAARTLTGRRSSSSFDPWAGIRGGGTP